MEILRVTWAKRGKDPQDLEGATTIKRVVKDAALAIIKIYAHCWYCRRWSKRLWHEFNSLLCKQSRERKWHRRVLLFWDCSWAKTRGKESIVKDPLAIDRFESCPPHTQHCSYCSKSSVSIPGGEETRSHAKDWRRDWRASLTMTGPLVYRHISEAVRTMRNVKMISAMAGKKDTIHCVFIMHSHSPTVK
jgi:hypothetical protein